MKNAILLALVLTSAVCMAFAVYAAENAKAPATAKAEQGKAAVVQSASNDHGLTEPVTISLLEAVKKKYVRFSASGSSIDSSYISIENITNMKLHLVIPAGTFLNAKSGSVQNMVLTSPEDIALGAKETYSRNVSTACMNIHRDIPDGDNTFGIAQHPDNHLLSKVIKLLNKGNYPYSVIQAAVWIVTDDASYEDTGILQGQFSGRVISHDDYKKAVSIVKEAKKTK